MHHLALVNYDKLWKINHIQIRIQVQQIAVEPSLYDIMIIDIQEYTFFPINNL